VEPEIFKDTNDSEWSGFRAWEARCKELGYEGPYRLSNPNTCWQFVRKEGGTAAIYNAAHGRGYVFREDAVTVDGAK
jgi:hypothetical protein